MKPAELAAKCAASINSASEYGTPAADATVLLVLPKGFKPPPRFPRGRTAQWKADGSRVAYFNAVNLLAWLAAHGAVTVSAGVRPRDNSETPAKS